MLHRLSRFESYDSIEVEQVEQVEQVEHIVDAPFLLLMTLTNLSIHISFFLPTQILPYRQSHYREVPRGEIFMEQELRFGLDLGQMANFPAFIASKSFDL
jgi:hypothetical protein